jgi:hypothetical protein
LREFRLKPHLVPRPLWGKSAANLVKRADWERIRCDALTAARCACQVCCTAAPHGGLNCHELWDYDDEDGTATLVGLRIQCKNCDGAVHIGLAVRRGFGKSAIAQLVKVNVISPREAKMLYRSAMDEWRRRNKKQWRIVVATFLVDRYPALAILES